VAFEANGKW